MSRPSLSNIALLSGSSHPALAQEVAESLGMALTPLEISRFPDGEISLQVMETIRGKDLFVIQTIALDPNNLLMELLIAVDALRRSTAETITAVIPYYGYCRQDRKDKPRVPITGKLVANMLQSAGVTRVLTMDLHTLQIQGFFDIPVDNLQGRSALIDAYRKLYPDPCVVVTPDIGSIKLAHGYAKALDTDLAIIDKDRTSPTDVAAVYLIGDVEGKNVLLADDMCSTAGTLMSAAKACREKGAKRIVAAVTHGLFVGEAVDKIENSSLELLLTTNTIPWTDRLSHSTKIKTVSVAPLFAQVITRYLSGQSLSALS